ncbi:hypothetical protein BIY21_12690 [Vibrio ponticus]|uniref:ABC transporter domain-containing protein n=1 Tax=Vibrio ponticus TaxID=265668 RepID=A0ABX3FGZ4_9VIBR|nr:metal ABC transporter ATP-binding protein [Vibrio ponticus]OLQ91867.1 hypothetical protein BIY21_12690 [Vibrio ponticus]
MRSKSLVATNISGPSVHLENISVDEGNLKLLNQVDVIFESGGWHAILGPNGGGKSTLLKTILGQKNHQGRLTIHWAHAPNKTNKTKQRIGYLPQLMPFDASLPISVRDYLLLNLSPKPIWFNRSLSDQIKHGLVNLGLEEKLGRKIGDLSGGERQRLMLCTALLQKPTILILDEPMTGLDKQGRDDCLQLLKQFHHAGGTIIMVEHDWQVVEQHCEHIYWVDKHLKKIDRASDFFLKNAAMHLALNASDTFYETPMLELNDKA